jgi:peptidoglycan/LPS O-acetylase OafA/YrhL
MKKSPAAMAIYKEKFHSFDALRFFSFFIVFLSHLPYALFNNLTFLSVDGTIGVYFFFTLSGFLITYILLVEKASTNDFNFKNFFARRVLRIWPLYYVVLLFAFCSSFIISFLNLPSSDVGYNPNWLMSSLFLENYMVIYHNEYANVSPMPVLWSLCVEEHFYIIWGVLIYLIKPKKVPVLIFLLIVVAFVSRIVFYNHNMLFKDILTNIDFFMFGAIPAYLIVNYKEKTVAFVSKIPLYIKVLLLVTALVYVFASSHLVFEYNKLVNPLVFGLLFSAILFVFIPQENKLKISDSSVFSKLGLYTYSLYLLHVIVIHLLIQLFNKFHLSIEHNSVYFILLALALTIFASYLSYILIEKPFLRLKKFF